MISTKLHAQQLAALLLAKNIIDIVLAPGSRSGPLIHTFTGCGRFDCRTVVDERSAGYFALGLAQQKERPVVLLCSSGTAAINFAPAVAEAYYLGVSLVVITADRPQYWIDQLENQCINQHNLYHNMIKKSCVLPLEETEKKLWFAVRKINELLNCSVSGKKGPVHINIPFEEPLHKTVTNPLPEIRQISVAETESSLSPEELDRLAEIIGSAEKIMILVGQQMPDQIFTNELFVFARKYKPVILAEHLANLPPGKRVFFRTDLLFQAVSIADCGNYQPDLLITCGGQCVSRAAKQFLRQHRPQYHLHLGDNSSHIDTYQALTTVIPLPAACFFAQINTIDKRCSENGGWFSSWERKNKEVEEKYNAYVKRIPFSDMQVYSRIFSAIPENSVIHLGNSSVIRYGLLASPKTGAIYLGNRGTSGIDGSLSTAIGYASSSPQINTVIVGDLSFFYDSNALWNKYIKKNLRIILINNGGGNIFGFLEDLEKSPAFQQHFLVEHRLKAGPVVNAFGINYMAASSDSDLTKRLAELYRPEIEEPYLLEVFTDSQVNTATYKKLLISVKTV